MTTQHIRCILEATANGLEGNFRTLIEGAIGKFRRTGVDTDAALEEEILQRARETRRLDASKGVSYQHREMWFGGVCGMDALAIFSEMNCRVVILQEDFPTVNICASNRTTSNCELSSSTPLVTDYAIEHVWIREHFEAERPVRRLPFDASDGALLATRRKDWFIYRRVWPHGARRGQKRCRYGLPDREVGSGSRQRRRPRPRDSRGNIQWAREARPIGLR